MPQINIKQYCKPIAPPATPEDDSDVCLNNESDAALEDDLDIDLENNRDTTDDNNPDERIPGGKPTAPASRTVSGKSFYYGSNADGEELAIEGILYEDAGNYAHQNDTSVTVEDFSNLDIEACVLAKFEAILPSLLKSPISSIADTGFHFDGDASCLVERFACCGLMVERRTYLQIDISGAKSEVYTSNPFAKKIEESLKLKPSEELPKLALVQLVMAELLAKEKGALLNPATVKWRRLASRAHGRLHRCRESVKAMTRYQQILQGAEPLSPHQQRSLTLIRENHKKDIHNRHHQLLVDRALAGSCERISGQDVVILRDKNHEIIAGVLVRATQKLFPKDTVERLDRAVRVFAWRYPYTKVDVARHGTCADDHFVSNPDKNVREEKNKHHACCGTDHYGVRHPVGHSGPADLILQEFSRAQHKTPGIINSIAWRDEFPVLKSSVYMVSQ